MKVKQLLLLIGAAVVLGLIYANVSGRGNSGNSTQREDLLKGIPSARVSKLQLSQGQEEIELAVKDGQWTLPIRSSYPADASKVNAFLLKLFDLSSSQRVPSSADTLKNWGWLMIQYWGSSKVVLKDNADKELGSLLLGKRREDKPGDDPAAARAPTTSGQYVRRGGEDHVYLIGLPVTLTLGVSNWLDTVVANIREASVYSVEQNKREGENTTKVFSMARKPMQPGHVPALELDVTPGPEEEAQESVISQIRSGLENSRLTDVKSAADPEMKSLVYDRHTLYRLNNGLVYTVATAEKTQRFFGTVRVAFDPTLAAQLKSEHDAALKEYETVKAAYDAGVQDSLKKTAATDDAKNPVGDQPKDGKAQGAESDPSGKPPAELEVPKAAPAKPELSLAEAEEADALNKRYEPWVYEFVTYQGKKYRYEKSDLFKKKDAAPADVGPGPGPGAGAEGVADAGPAGALDAHINHGAHGGPMPSGEDMQTGKDIPTSKDIPTGENTSPGQSMPPGEDMPPLEQ